MDDHTIIRRIQGGDVDAYAGLVRKYHRNLLAFIFRIVRDAHLAEDIGQEVFLNVYKELPRFAPDRGTPFSAWLYISARNRCISELRKQGRRELAPIEQYHLLASGEQTAEAALISREDREALSASLVELPEPFRSTILMSLQGASLDDIAERCGVPLSTVKTRLFRAREKLKLLLKEHFGGIAHERRI
jgi:RNA polymerase sigma-70 factor, ECF subfamily